MIIAALGFFSRISFTTSSVCSGFTFWVRLNTITVAYSIWLLKNSPNAFICLVALAVFTTVTRPDNFTSFSASTSCTDFITSESFPTPDGSIKIRSGWNRSITSRKFFPKSPTREQQMQPEFNSLTSMPESFKKPPSMPISPNSFSINTIFSPWNTSSSIFLIKVVFPAPKKPEIISIFVMIFPPFPNIFPNDMLPCLFPPKMPDGKTVLPYAALPPQCPLPGSHTGTLAPHAPQTAG